MTRRALPALALVLLWAAPLCAQEPDRRGEVALKDPVYQGTKANAPIPASMHIRNEGGSNGAGLCVIASAVINGHYQGVPDLDKGKGSLLWRTAKRRPGGYGPDKLERLLREVMPDEPWVNYLGRDRQADADVLTKLSAKGYPIGATMNTGQLYHYMPIHHMISLVHFKKDATACVVDNNDPGVYHWMPAAEFLRRWYDGGSGWAFVWSRLPATVDPAGSPPAVVAAALVFLAAATLLGGSILVIHEAPDHDPVPA